MSKKFIIIISALLAFAVAFFIVPIHYISVELPKRTITVEYEQTPKKNSYYSVGEWAEENLKIIDAETLKIKFKEFYKPSILFEDERRLPLGIVVLWKVKKAKGRPVEYGEPYVFFHDGTMGYVAGVSFPESAKGMISYWSGKLKWNPKGEFIKASPLSKSSSLGLSPPPGEYMLMAGEGKKFLRFRVVSQQKAS